ncbi:SGNH/GDSL hydrolase family protein [Microbacterium mangrovi]|uniref:SGNH/GDSL hydrolase family protein n=1 Tax=Microbacterium mangrovi TaxID=1348253 RepID=UPI0009DDFF66|nr:SGNH/GDSL hydrolase family protein [Microbacterium mangrovi]
MHAHGRFRARRPWLLVGAALVVAVLCALLATRPWDPLQTPADASGGKAAAQASGSAPLVLRPGERVLVFGDSWVYGSAAIRPTLGFAYLLADKLDVHTIVAGVRGSGYLKPGIDGPAYGARIAALDPSLDPELIIVEGSINDRHRYPTGYRAAVTSAWNALAAKYPKAQIVILGPAPQVLPVEPATAKIDTTLRELAAARSWPYLSPIAEKWITPANYLDVIDTSRTASNHPSTAGHAYLADRVAADLRKLERAPVVAAEGSPSPTP